MVFLHKARNVVQLFLAVLACRTWPDVALKLLPLLAKYERYRTAAWLIDKSTHHVAGTGTKYRVLAIEKAIFVDDISDTFGNAENYTAYGLPRAVLKSLALGILPSEICHDDRYLADHDAAREAKLKYRRVCSNVWQHLKARAKYDAIVTGNWAYWAEREWAMALKDAGDPFIVLHKEGIKPPAINKMLLAYHNEVRTPFQGSRMIVYQEEEYRHQLAGKFVTQDRLAIGGIPRIDELHNWRKRAAAKQVHACDSRPLILVLALLPSKHLPSHYFGAHQMSWASLSRELVACTEQAARAEPNAQFIIRPRPAELAEYRALVTDTWQIELPDNVMIDATDPIQRVLQSSWAVVGLNTTSLLEAIAIGKPVIEPRFCEAAEPQYRDYIIDLMQATLTAATPEELVALMVKHARTRPQVPPTLSESAKSSLMRWTGNPDGRAVERILEVITSDIEHVRGASRS